MAYTERIVVEVDWTDENVGMEVMGRLVSIEKVQYKDGPGMVYAVKSNTSGEVIRFRGVTRLNQKLSLQDIGKLVAIKYKGEDKSRQMPAGMSYPKDFFVAVDENSNKPVEPNQHGVKITDEDIGF